MVFLLLRFYEVTRRLPGDQRASGPSTACDHSLSTTSPNSASDTAPIASASLSRPRIRCVSATAPAYRCSSLWFPRFFGLPPSASVNVGRSEKALGAYLTINHWRVLLRRNIPDRSHPHFIPHRVAAALGRRPGDNADRPQRARNPATEPHQRLFRSQAEC